MSTTLDVRELKGLYGRCEFKTFFLLTLSCLNLLNWLIMNLIVWLIFFIRFLRILHVWVKLDKEFDDLFVQERELDKLLKNHWGVIFVFLFESELKLQFPIFHHFHLSEFTFGANVLTLHVKRKIHDLWIVWVVWSFCLSNLYRLKLLIGWYVEFKFLFRQIHWVWLVSGEDKTF